MKIELSGTLPSGAASGFITLCEHATEPMGPVDGHPSKVTERVIQPTAPMHELFAGTIYRGLRRNHRSFTAARLFTNFTDAEDFCETHEETLPHTATLRITTYASSGSARVRTYSNAQLHTVECINMGKTVYINYALSFGARTS